MIHLKNKVKKKKLKIKKKKKGKNYLLKKKVKFFKFLLNDEITKILNCDNLNHREIDNILLFKIKNKTILTNLNEKNFDNKYIKFNFYVFIINENDFNNERIKTNLEEKYKIINELILKIINYFKNILSYGTKLYHLFDVWNEFLVKKNYNKFSNLIFQSFYENFDNFDKKIQVLLNSKYLNWEYILFQLNSIYNQNTILFNFDDFISHFIIKNNQNTFFINLIFDKNQNTIELFISKKFLKNNSTFNNGLKDLIDFFNYSNNDDEYNDKIIDDLKNINLSSILDQNDFIFISNFINNLSILSWKLSLNKNF